MQFKLRNKAKLPGLGAQCTAGRSCSSIPTGTVAQLASTMSNTIALDDDSDKLSSPYRGLFVTLCRACGLPYLIHQRNGKNAAATSLASRMVALWAK